MQVRSRLKSFTTVLVTIVALASAGLPNARAQAPRLDPNSFPDQSYKVKTAEELFQLTPERRIQYLEGLQQLVVELEDIYPEGWHKPLPEVEVSRLNFMIQKLIDKAYAATGAEYSRVAPVVRYARGAKLPSVKCGLGLQPARVNGGTDYVCRRVGLYSKGCGPGFISVSQQANGSFGCITITSFNKLTKENKVGLRASNKYAAANPKLAAVNKAHRSIKTIYDSQPKTALKVVKPSPKPKKKSISAIATDKKSLINSKFAESKIQDDDEVPLSTPESESLPLPGEAVKFKGIAESELETAPLPTEEGQRFAEMDRACFAPTPENECTEQSIQTARDALYGTKQPLCIYAGNFSFYKAGKMFPGNCQRPFEFCYGKGSCRNEKWDIVAKVSSVSCKPSQVLCNPYLFSIQPNGKGYCVDPGSDATNKCMELTSKDKADVDKPIVDREANHFLTRYVYSEGLTDDQREGFKRGYDEFAAQINSLCFNKEDEGDGARSSNVRKAFCVECNVIKRRLLRMNALTIISKEGDTCSALRVMHAFDPAKVQSGSQPSSPSNNSSAPAAH